MEFASIAGFSRVAACKLILFRFRYFVGNFAFTYKIYILLANWANPVLKSDERGDYV